MNPPQSRCTRCGALFGCAMADGGGGPCWCMTLPQAVPVPVPGQDAGCWCPACLKQHIAQSATAAPATRAPD